MLTSLVAASPKIAPDLAERVRGLAGSTSVDAVLFLSAQPVAREADRALDRYWANFSALSLSMRTLAALARPVGPLRPEEEAQAFERMLGNLDHGALAILAQEADRLRDRMLQEALLRGGLEAVRAQFAVASLVRQSGGLVRSGTIAVNTLAVTVPVGSLEALAADERIRLIAWDAPGFPELDVSAPTVGAPTFWSQGFVGTTFDAGVLDTGVQQNHPAFAGVRFESNMGVSDTGTHGTAMAGIIASRDNLRRGLGFGLDTMSVARAGNDSTSMAGMNYLMTGVVERAETVNYSFGNGTANTQDYAPIDQFFDGVCDTFQVMVSKSTGNNGFSSGAPTITHPAPAFNLMAVANLDDRNTVNRADDRINSSSSTGPTLGGRKKPDIGAPGTNIDTTNPSGGFSNVTGTSPAAPHISGAILLLNHLGVLSPIAAKAVLLNSTDAIDSKNTSSTTDDEFVPGSFWDRRYGWGYLNLARAFVQAPYAVADLLPAPAPDRRSFKLYRCFLFANEKATLVWNRRVAYNGPAYPTIVRPLSNLDLFAYRVSDGGLSRSSASTIDNVEQLSVPADGDYVLKVASTGLFDPNIASERFGLAAQEGLAEALGPQADIAFAFRRLSEVASDVWLDVDVRNIGDLPMFGVQVALQDATVLEGDNPRTLGRIDPGQTVSVRWKIRAVRTGPTKPLAVVTSASYGESFRWERRQP